MNTTTDFRARPDELAMELADDLLAWEQDRDMLLGLVDPHDQAMRAERDRKIRERLDAEYVEFMRAHADSNWDAEDAFEYELYQLRGE